MYIIIFLGSNLYIIYTCTHYKRPNAQNLCKCRLSQPRPHPHPHGTACLCFHTTPGFPELLLPLPINSPTEGVLGLPLWGDLGAMVDPHDQLHCTHLVWPDASVYHSMVVRAAVRSICTLCFYYYRYHVSTVIYKNTWNYKKKYIGYICILLLIT